MTDTEKGLPEVKNVMVAEAVDSAGIVGDVTQHGVFVPRDTVVETVRAESVVEDADVEETDAEDDDADDSDETVVEEDEELG